MGLTSNNLNKPPHKMHLYLALCTLELLLRADGVGRHLTLLFALFPRRRLKSDHVQLLSCMKYVKDQFLCVKQDGVKVKAAHVLRPIRA